MTIKLGSPLLILTALFVALKLTGVITWSWWIVTLPLWIGPAIVVGMVLAALAFASLVGLVILLLAILSTILD